jgi:hypothetical protein
MSLPLITSPTMGQDVANNIRTATVRIGLSHTHIQDHRMSAVAQHAWSPKYEVGYRQTSEKRISQIRMQFTSINSNSGSLLSLRSIKPAIYYSYERQVQTGIWVGGFIDHSTLLNFPSTRTALYNNNPIAYHIGQSIGPRLTYSSPISAPKGGDIGYSVSGQAALLSYMIQPAYGHPYPERYLQAYTFSPTRAGMAGPLLRSGKVRTINAVRSFRLEMGVFFYLSDKVMFSIDYNADVLYANTQGKALHTHTHDIYVGASYIH